MIYLQLFLVFFEIGLVSFGGGYAMISLIVEKVTSYGWANEEELLNMIAVSESTPGPIAINIATFIGSKTSGLTGAVVCTLGVILPSFIIIILLCAVLKNLFKYDVTKNILEKIRPAIVGIILSTAIIMLLAKFFNITNLNDFNNISFKGLEILIFFILVIIYLLSKYKFKKNISPIIYIIISAILGIIVFTFV